MTDVIFVYITAGSESEAALIGRALVEDRLAACVNIFPHMQSIYRFEGNIEETAEAVLIAKTTKSLLDRLSTRVKDMHSYEVPCIVSFAVDDGEDDYLSWLRSSVQCEKMPET
ncbi:MAG: divalent-cation tolerance protein CutA [Alphaproteobacteria bacterium]|nr:divalent-cation tolerance protein CutA [Alphaproteobacteria bacterium]